AHHGRAPSPTRRGARTGLRNPLLRYRAADQFAFAGMGPDQHTVASALHVCSSKTMKSRNSSQLTVFLLTVYFLIPRSAVHCAMYLSRRSLASRVGPSLP